MGEHYDPTRNYMPPGLLAMEIKGDGGVSRWLFIGQISASIGFEYDSSFRRIAADPSPFQLGSGWEAVCRTPFLERRLPLRGILPISCQDVNKRNPIEMMRYATRFMQPTCPEASGRIPS
jgi:hypothetical protein